MVALLTVTTQPTAGALTAMATAATTTLAMPAILSTLYTSNTQKWLQWLLCVTSIGAAIFLTCILSIYILLSGCCTVLAPCTAIGSEYMLSWYLYMCAGVRVYSALCRPDVQSVRPNLSPLSWPFRSIFHPAFRSIYYILYSILIRCLHRWCAMKKVWSRKKDGIAQTRQIRTV